MRHRARGQAMVLSVVEDRKPLPLRVPDGARTVWLVGDLDAENVPAVRHHLLGLLAVHGPAPLVVDVSRVRFVDGDGVGLLLALRGHQADLGADLVIRRASARVQAVLDLAGCTDLSGRADLPLPGVPPSGVVVALPLPSAP